MGALAWVAEMKAKASALVTTGARLLLLDDAERAIADDRGVAYFSEVKAMGSLRSWAWGSQRYLELPEQP
jgi:hypothetical protein